MQKSKFLTGAVLAAVSVFLLGAAVFAHEGEGHKDGGRGMSRMTQALNLTADQQAQLKPIFESQHAQMRAVRSDNSLTAEQKKAKAKEIRQATDSQIQPILNAEQQEKLKQIRAERHEHHKGGHKKDKTAGSTT